MTDNVSMELTPETTTRSIEVSEGVLMQAPPQIVIDQAREAAKALKDVIDHKEKPVMINGKIYLEFEDWQTLGRFYGYTAGTMSTRKMDNGWEAVAAVYHNGQIVSRAVSMCTRDERLWKTREEFALRSMAQTRACAKALRNVLSWTAVLAGYAGTPAEEVTADMVKTTRPTISNTGAPTSTNGKCPECGAMGKYHRPNCSLAGR